MAESIQKVEASAAESSKGVCMVCCEEIKYFSIGSCDHPICHKCSSRMRVLASQKYCPSCRCELDQVVFSHQEILFADFTLNKLLGNRKHGIRFEDGAIRKAFDSLLDYVCSICGDGPMGSMQDLKSHVRKEHERQFCLICMQNLAAFPSELKLYTKKELVRHRKDGDNDEKSHRGHPECRFCDERYFDNDALLLHLRKSHFWCHFCEHDGKQDYYDVYDSLRQHFASEHYLCDEGACAQEKFTSVFRDKIDYQAHKLATHRKKLNKFQAKEARKVDIDYKFEPRSGASNAITGADYEDVQQNTRQDARRRQGNNTKSGTNHRYHREANGTLNFYDYEDVEKDRKKFLGKTRRHEAEEVDGAERSKVTRRIAATRSLSQSEPDIPSHFEGNPINRPFDDVDGVIGFSERISDDIVKSDTKETAKQSASVKPKPSKPPEPKKSPVETNINEDENFPSLPGAKPFIPLNVKKRTEDFPALPLSASAAKPANSNWNSGNMTNNSKKEITHINGVVVKTAKSKKKGKSKQIKQPDSTDFPALGTSQPPTSKPPPSKFNKFDAPVTNGTANTSKKSESPKPPPSKFNTFDDVVSQKKSDSGKQSANKANKFEDVPLSSSKSQSGSKKVDSAKPPPSKFNKFEQPSTPKEKRKTNDKKDKQETVKDSSSDPKPVEKTLSNDKHAKRPPPGLAATAAKENLAPNLKSGPPGLNKGAPQSTLAGPPPGLKPQNMDTSMMERNMRLLGMLMQFLDGFSMNTFKELSGNFRRGLTNGQEYYDGISELLGDNLKYVFSELVALLPDEDKRNELLRVNNDVKLKSKRMKEEKWAARESAPAVNADYSKPAVWGAQSKQEAVEEIQESRCEKCGVVVRNDKIQEHLQSHGEAFPALPVTTKKKKNYSFHSSARVNKAVPVRSAWGK